MLTSSIFSIKSCVCIQESAFTLRRYLSMNSWPQKLCKKLKKPDELKPQQVLPRLANSQEEENKRIMMTMMMTNIAKMVI